MWRIWAAEGHNLFIHKASHLAMVTMMGRLTSGLSKFPLPNDPQSDASQLIFIIIAFK